MLQIRIHGRGGQGVVTAAEMLSVAAFHQGRHAQAFPSFGSERTGAPVVAFCRIDDRPIRLREPISAPDVLIIQDAHLLHQVDVFQGLGPRGYVLINSVRTAAELGLADIVARLPPGHLLTLPATEIAMTHLKRPLPNAVLLGGFAAMTGMITLEAVVHAIHDKFKGPVFTGSVADRNAAAATEAFATLMAIRSAENPSGKLQTAATQTAATQTAATQTAATQSDATQTDATQSDANPTAPNPIAQEPA